MKPTGVTPTLIAEVITYLSKWQQNDPEARALLVKIELATAGKATAFGRSTSEPVGRDAP